MTSLKSTMPVLVALTLSAGIGVFAQGNSAFGHANGNGNGSNTPQSRLPAWGRWHLVPPGLSLGVTLGSSMLVPAADLPADLLNLLPVAVAGTDPLTNGEVTVRGSGKVDVTLNGAAASQPYDLWFCHYSTLSNRCGSLGTAQTDADGHVNASFDFLAPGAAAAGVFAISRSGAIQFVSGFRARSAAQGVPIALEGKVAVVTPSTHSFTLQNTSLIVVTDTSTEFMGVANLPALAAGDLVLIKGMLMTDGTVLASSVKLQ